MGGDRIPGSVPDYFWHKDAVIYELHVKSFFDGNGDGIGDFTGLIEKLDYLVDLGITCVWLLPFYASPMRDDGYDVAHYERVDPRFGSLEDFDRFVRAAHRSGLQVMTDLVVNHTSDTHPWFQAARRAPAGSPKRDFYVWSDTDRRYSGARVIFHDVESSNWTWDPAAGAYYWHRFFHHQPDLNFDNPRVRRAVLKVMRFWLDRGVDGLRLDAVSHLFEREGTTCENLPETHDFLKQVRAAMDRRYENRVLLAEANQGAAPYFADGDECHMAFHFPLLPRLFLALDREEAEPIVEIVRQTANVPDGCQWAVFLRNHDEMTLSALPEAERATLFRAYAPEAPMRLNHGIRRRLAPLLRNDRARIELAYALLLSLPGTPVLYYGDEIGMGDNVSLNDRDGMRTPMQWSAERHGGFTHATPSPFVPPPIEDPTYGYRAVNVAEQQRDSNSLLAAIRRLICARRRQPAFGRGSVEFLRSGSPNVLAFLRRHLDETILVVANLSGVEQTAALKVPGGPCQLLDLILEPGASCSFRPGPDHALTLGPRVCHWFQVVRTDARELRPFEAGV
jgi:maltose alpha-D-glucosyltransferase/alpha-amylase